jgi:hypothetical protein
MEAYGGMDVQIHIFLTSALAGGEWSASRPCRFTPGESGCKVCTYVKQLLAALGLSVLQADQRSDTVIQNPRTLDGKVW